MTTRRIPTASSSPPAAEQPTSGTAADYRPLRASIDEWITNSEIRRDVLKALIAVLVTLVLVTGIIFGGATTALDHLFGVVLSTTLGKILAGSTMGLGIGGGLWRRHRRRRRQAATGPLSLPPAPDPSQSSSPDASADS